MVMKFPYYHRKGHHHHNAKVSRLEIKRSKSESERWFDKAVINPGDGDKIQRHASPMERSFSIPGNMSRMEASPDICAMIEAAKYDQVSFW